MKISCIKEQKIDCRIFLLYPCYLNKVIFSLHQISPFTSPFSLFLGLNHHNGVVFSIWCDSYYQMSYFQGQFLQVIEDVITFWHRGKIVTVCFQLMVLCLFQWNFLNNQRCSLCQFIFSHMRTLGIQLGLNLGPNWKQFYQPIALPLS